MDEQNINKHLNIRIAVRIITVLLSIPFGFFILMAIIFSTDSPYQGTLGTVIRLALFIVPLTLLTVSLISKKLYWLWLAIMIIIFAGAWGYSVYINNSFTAQSANIINSNKNDFDCVDPVFNSPSYLSIKDNGDIVNVTSINKISFENTIGKINANGDVNFTGINEQYKDSYLNCTNKDGKLFKDVYSNVTFFKN